MNLNNDCLFLILDHIQHKFFFSLSGKFIYNIITSRSIYSIKLNGLCILSRLEILKYLFLYIPEEWRSKAWPTKVAIRGEREGVNKRNLLNWVVCTGDLEIYKWVYEQDYEKSWELGFQGQISGGMGNLELVKYIFSKLDYVHSDFLDKINMRTFLNAVRNHATIGGHTHIVEWVNSI